MEEKMPEYIKISRIVDPDLSISMQRYINMVVLFYQKNFQLYFDNYEKKQWKPFEKPERELKIGILGAGEMGREVAISLHQTALKSIQAMAWIHLNQVCKIPIEKRLIR